MIERSIKDLFLQKFFKEPIICRSPGRINIIGEHTDYNEGFVLPAAIDKAIYVALSKRDDHLIHLYSVDYAEDYSIPLNEIAPTKTWATYILGVVHQLKLNGFQVSGFNLVIDGDVPIGAGLSSSAAVECAVVVALNKLFELNLNKMQMVKIAQKAEHHFSGVMCGIMDMFTSVFGKKNHAIKLDCRSLEFEYAPIKLDGYKILLLNTNVKHSLASSAYNERRQQCEQGVAWIQQHEPTISSLRYATLEMLNQYVLPKDKIVYQRCKYVVEEISRVVQACKNLQKGNIKALGEKMFATHNGLSKEYEVSCKELDYMVDAVKNNNAVLGARMMGGGFGGCTINIIEEHKVDEIIDSISNNYRINMGLPLTAYRVNIEDGSSVITATDNQLHHN